MNIKKGDTVVMLSGKNKGKKGKVLVCMPDEGKVIVEGIAMSTQHKKPRRQGDQGGIITVSYTHLLKVLCNFYYKSDEIVMKKSRHCHFERIN